MPTVSSELLAPVSLYPPSNTYRFSGILTKISQYPGVPREITNRNQLFFQCEESECVSGSEEEWGSTEVVERTGPFVLV